MKENTMNKMSEWSDVETRTLAAWVDLNLNRLDFDADRLAQGNRFFDEETRDKIIGEVAMIGIELYERGYYD